MIKSFKWTTLLLGLVIGVILAIVIDITIAPSLQPKIKLSTDFQSLVVFLLTLSALLIAIVGLFVGALAFLGFKNLEKITKESAMNQVELMLAEENEKGRKPELRRRIEEIASKVAEDTARESAENLIADIDSGLAKPHEWGDFDSDYGEDYEE